MYELLVTFEEGGVLVTEGLAPVLTCGPLAVHLYETREEVEALAARVGRLFVEVEIVAVSEVE